MSIHVLQAAPQAQRWEPVKVKVVVRNRREVAASDFNLDIYKNLWSPPGSWAWAPFFGQTGCPCQM